MKPLAFICLVFGFLFSTISVIAQETEAKPGFNPETFLMSHFTFTRPKDWQWTDTRSDGTKTLQVVVFRTNVSDPKEDGRAYFNHFPPDKPAGTRKAVVSRWNELFVNEGKPPVEFSRSEKIGKNKIYYIELSGTYKVEHAKPGTLRHGYSLFGAVVEDDKGNLVIRLMGATTSVEKSKVDFQKMIEQALGKE